MFTPSSSAVTLFIGLLTAAGWHVEASEHDIELAQALNTGDANAAWELLENKYHWTYDTEDDIREFKMIYNSVLDVAENGSSTNPFLQFVGRDPNFTEEGDFTRPIETPDPDLVQYIRERLLEKHNVPTV